jgi:hypothetical protein
MIPTEVIENKGKLSKWKDIIDIAHSICVILAIIGAGVWFYKQGEIRPKADITHDINCQDIHKNNKLVHILINIKNIGKTPIDIYKGTIRLQQITPLTEKLLKDIDNGVDIVNQDIGIVSSWPFACEKGEYVLNDKISIEVGETRRVDYDFIIPRNVTIVKLYSYFEVFNSANWKTVTIYAIK